jgi:iron complex transport system substrate-binding protein
MLRRVLLCLTALSLLLVGCGKPEVKGTSTSRPKIYLRIVSLSPSTTEVLFFLRQNLPKSLIGRTKYDDEPGMAASIPILGDVKPYYEKIQAAKPDLVVYDKGIYSDDDIAKIKGMGIKTYEYGPKTLEDYKRQLFEIAELIGGEDKASKMVDEAFAAAGNARASVTKPTSVAVIMPGKGSEHMIAGAQTFVANMAKETGCKVVGPDVDKFVNLSPEVLLQQDPDCIITAGDATPFVQDSRFANLKAMKNHRVFGIINQGLCLRAGHRVDKLLETIGKIVSK